MQATQSGHIILGIGDSRFQTTDFRSEPEGDGKEAASEPSPRANIPMWRCRTDAAFTWKPQVGPVVPSELTRAVCSPATNILISGCIPCMPQQSGVRRGPRLSAVHPGLSRSRQHDREFRHTDRSGHTLAGASVAHLSKGSCIPGCARLGWGANRHHVQ
jgi:hypothetical protein